MILFYNFYSLPHTLTMNQNISYEPKKIYKKQEVRNENLTSKQSGWGGWIRTNE